MMIKLLFVALLCVAVFADSEDDQIGPQFDISNRVPLKMWLGPGSAMGETARIHSLVKRAAQNQPPGPPPQGRPPQGGPPQGGPQGQQGQQGQGQYGQGQQG
ncbi:acidic proline-rich protein PRP25-like isoform X1 [Pogonomyrmex barbatus]|uniref:Acidic proline-rich protein PRP25-like isoform X1 n=1 Tax=Pogonomyrmex barbatus TaxID=144034 RepID=A0A6I9WKL7_9HYME|nr:acidic proline-rich protein PRP25-like isoform X1 [Pogonomyrmex barbatus]